jgi:O-antigen/teichoic acid export membrane protein
MAGSIEFVPLILAGPSLSLLSNTYGNGDLRRFRKLVLASVGLVFAFTVLTAGAVAILAPWIVRIYGDRYMGATAVLQVACAMVVMRATGRATSQVIMATGRLWVEFTCSLLRMALQLALLWLLFIGWGAVGLGLSMFIAFVLQLILQGGYIWLAVGRSHVPELDDVAGDAAHR